MSSWSTSRCPPSALTSPFPQPHPAGSVGYTLTFGSLLIVFGRAGDLLGRHRLFLIGLTVFTVASLADPEGGVGFLRAELDPCLPR